MDIALQEAFDAGYTAALNGKPSTRNPHHAPAGYRFDYYSRTPSGLHDAWARGHSAALAEEASEQARLENPYG